MPAKIFFIKRLANIKNELLLRLLITNLNKNKKWENYGGEICNKNWLTQFARLETNNYVRYNRNINGISGATISVNSIKNDVFKLTNTLKKSITK